MAIRGFMTNNLVADYDTYKEFSKHRQEEIKKDKIGYTPVLFYKPGLMYGKHTRGKANDQKMYVAICKCACMTIAYNVWYDIAKDYVISKGATSYKEFVDIPMTAVKKFKSKAEKAIKDAVCDLNGRTKAYRNAKFDACRYLAMYWTYLDCIKDTSTQRYFPTQLTILRAAKVFGYEEHENPFIMNGKYIHHDKEESMKTTGREINPIPEEKVGEIIDEFMKDELDPKTVSVEDMDFSMIKTYHCLQRSNIRTLDQLLRMSPSEIIKIRNIGHKSYEEIKSKVEEYGYFYPNMSTPAIVVTDDGKEYVNKKNGSSLYLCGLEMDTSNVVDEQQDDISKFPDAILKKISDLKKENEALDKENEELKKTNEELAQSKLKDMEAYRRLQNEYDDLNRVYHKADKIVEALRKEKDDRDTKIDKLANIINDKDAYINELKKANERLSESRGKSAEDCSIDYLINVILRKMDENHQPILITVIDDMLVDIHSKEFEPKKPVRDYGSYSIRTREG